MCLGPTFALPCCESEANITKTTKMVGLVRTLSLPFYFSFNRSFSAKMSHRKLTTTERAKIQRQCEKTTFSIPQITSFHNSRASVAAILESGLILQSDSNAHTFLATWKSNTLLNSKNGNENVRNLKRLNISNAAKLQKSNSLRKKWRNMKNNDW